MIFTVLSVVLVLYSCLNFKKGLMLFVIYQIFWYPTLIIKVSNLPLNTTILLTFSYSIMYLLQKKKYKRAKDKFPYSVPFLLTIFSYVLTTFFALSGFSTEFARALTYIMKDYILIWILWDVLESKSDFKFLFKGVTVVIAICCIYGMFEYTTGINLLLDYKVVLSSDTIILYDTTGIRGNRLTSLFEHPIGAGMTLGLYSIFTLTLWQEKRYMPYKSISILVAFICIPCILLTKMRTAILLTIICTFSFIDLKALRKKRFFYLVLIAVFSTPFIILLMGDYISVLTKMFTASTSSSIGGSSLAMRMNQLEAISYIVKQSPIAGLGETFRSYITRSVYTDAALGYEGLWFEKITMHGIVGVISVIVMIYYSVIKIPKKYKSKPACAFALAYWIAYSFSSIPSFRMALFFLAEFYFIKISEVYRISVDNESGKREG